MQSGYTWSATSAVILVLDSLKSRDRRKVISTFDAISEFPTYYTDSKIYSEHPRPTYIALIDGIVYSFLIDDAEKTICFTALDI